MGKRLLVLSGPDEGRVFPLADGEAVLFGRSRATDARLIDPHVSRVHCQVQLEEGRAVVSDFDSAGGTFINGKKVAREPLRPGDILRIGNTRVQLVEDISAPAVAAPVASAAPMEALPVATPVPSAPPVRAARASRTAAVAAPPTRVPTRTAVAEARPAGKWYQELVGQTISSYKIESILAKSQSGYVFHGRDIRKNRPVALKVLEPAFGADPAKLKRFVSVLKHVMPLRHPNLVQVYSAGKSGKHCWIAMEYVQGENLAAVIARIETTGMLDWRQVVRFAVYILRALDYAHRKKLLHRNVTPQNILLGSRPQETKLVDLMLAKAVETGREEDFSSRSLINELPFISPERTRGSKMQIDGRADIYSLGATLYAMLTGQPPFTGSTHAEIIAKINHDEPIRLKEFFLGIPDALDQIISKMMAKDPNQRYTTAGAALKELEALAKSYEVSL